MWAGVRRAGGDGGAERAGQPDAWCPCPLSDPHDTDGRGACDNDDVCAGDDTVDTDGDGVNDGIEVSIGRNPTEVQSIETRDGIVANFDETANHMVLIIVKRGQLCKSFWIKESQKITLPTLMTFFSDQ